MKTNQILSLSLCLWTTVSVFTDSDFSVETPPNSDEYEANYDFAPDAGSPGVEVAPLEVNSQDQDVPYPPAPEKIVPAEAVGETISIGQSTSLSVLQPAE